MMCLKAASGNVREKDESLRRGDGRNYVKDLAGSRAGGGKIDLLCANVCKRKRLLEDRVIRCFAGKRSSS